MNPPLVITGSIAIDRIMRFSGVYEDYIKPDMLHSLSISVFLDDQSDSYGGVGANIAYSMAMLGEHPVLLGAVGPDGTAYMEHLRNLGVDTTKLHHSKSPTAAFNVITDSKHNQIGGFNPGAMLDSAALGLEDWRGTGAIVVVSPHDPAMMRKQVEQCKTYGLRLVYDVGQQVSNAPVEDIAAGIDAATVLILNEYEMSLACAKVGRSASSVKSAVPVVVTTLGDKGSLIEGADLPHPIQVPVVAANKAEDPTGAGDAYRAGFLYGYIRDWPLEHCAQLGAACGVFAVESTGTQTHSFTLRSVRERCEKAYKITLPK